MGKTDSSDPKKAEKKAKKRAKKEAKKEAKRLKKEQKRREKENRTHSNEPQQEHTTNAEEPAQTTTVQSTKDSIFFQKRVHVSVSLLPAAMKNIQAALEESIRGMILKYTEKVGVLMTFKNIKIISNNGNGIILNELPFIHYQVAFDSLVFNPSVGSKLQGKLTESFPSHIGVLVLGFFNAMIPAEKLTQAGFAFDNDLQEWAKEDGSCSFSKDDKIDFIVDRIHESVGTLSIEGSNPELSPFSNYPCIVPAAEASEEDD